MTTQLSLLPLAGPQPSQEQLAAAHAGPQGAYLISAGPGTGKTFTMVERFAWLVRACRVPVEQVLAVTFTDKAAEELRERVGRELASQDPRRRAEVDGGWIGTFHAICRRLLEEDAYLVGVPRELRVLDEMGQKLLGEQLTAQLRAGAEPAVDLERLTSLQPDEVAELLRHGVDFVLKLKGRGIGPEDFRRRALELQAGHDHAGKHAAAGAAEAEAIEVLCAVYSSYESRLRRARLLDFDDLILTTIRALREVPEFRAACRSRFRYLLVDEFQDSNQIQLELIRLLAADGYQNVAVVGDVKQSIYGWRDADVENIRSKFPGVKLPLTRNRRSFQQILDLAGDFIARDPELESEPRLEADRGAAPEAPVEVVWSQDAEEEAGMLAAEIKRLHQQGRPYSEIAVLARSLRHLPPEFEQRFQLEAIPYVTSAGGGFFDREEVKDVVALLRLTENPMDDGALVRVLQGPVVRLGDAGLYDLTRRRRASRGRRLRDCWDEALAEGHPELPEAVARRGRQVLAVTDRLAEAKEALTVADVMNRLLQETGYLRHCELRSLREGPRALLNLRKVFRLANRFERNSELGGVGDFVRHLDDMVEFDVDVPQMPIDSDDRPERTTKPDAVSLLTIHKAKGLEFPVVFLVNVKPPVARDTERLFFDPDDFGFVMKNWRGNKHPCYAATLPAARTLARARQEQRRLVYVGLTRARDRLYVSASRGEALPEAPEAEADDHFAEILTWALGRPEAARVVTAQQLELPSLAPLSPPAVPPLDVEGLLARVDSLRHAPAAAVPAAPASTFTLSFSQLQLFEACPVRYRFQEVWHVPAPPDELLPAAARRTAGDLGAAVHAALAEWHSGAADPLADVFERTATAAALSPAAVVAGRHMLAGYLAHALAAAPTLGTEVEFNLRVGDFRLRGLIDRVCELDGQLTLVDYKTNDRLEGSLLAAYETQLRLYGLAAEELLYPGRGRVRLVLFDLRRTVALPVAPDPAGVRERFVTAAGRIAGHDFALRPEHARRPCWTCAYRPFCPDAK